MWRKDLNEKLIIMVYDKTYPHHFNQLLVLAVWTPFKYGRLPMARHTKVNCWWALENPINAGVSLSSVSWLSDYLSSRTIAVRVGTNIISPRQPISAGK